MLSVLVVMESPPYPGELLLSSGVRPCIGCCLLYGGLLESLGPVMRTGAEAAGALSTKSRNPSTMNPVLR